MERTNLDRANRAERALLEYNGADSRPFGNDGRAEMLGDMLGDLRHYCRLYGVSFAECERRGFLMSEQERREDSDGAQFKGPSVHEFWRVSFYIDTDYGVETFAETVRIKKDGDAFGAAVRKARKSGCSSSGRTISARDWRNATETDSIQVTNPNAKKR